METHHHPMPELSASSRWVRRFLLAGVALLATLAEAGAPTFSISGTVFEDVNYGGGAGRTLAASGGTGINGVRMELYSGAGAYLATVNTAGGGLYSFGGRAAGTYIVRAVNGTVVSTRTGGCTVANCRPVQTFRTEMVAGVVTNVTDRVGGQVPASVDAGSNTTSATLASLTVGAVTPQSITTVTIGPNVTGINFGFNFDTIVNTNNTGQGSLRQWIENANRITGEGTLAQVGQTAARETSIFMIPNGVANPGQNVGYANQLTTVGANTGAARIAIVAALPTITGASTSLDGRTQTANVRATVGGAETNPGSIGTGGTVGTSAIALPQFERTEVVIYANNTQVNATVASAIIRGITVEYGGIQVSGASSEVRDCVVGMNADGTVTTTYGNTYGIIFGAGAGITISHNYVKVNNSNIRGDNPGADAVLEYNEIDSITGAPGGGHTNTFDGILVIGSATNVTVRYNLLKNMEGGGLEFGFTGGTMTGTATENTVTSNGFSSAGVPSTEGMGVAYYWLTAASTMTFSNNVVSNNGGPGIVVMRAENIVLTQNSVFGNGTSAGLGIDLDPRVATDPNTYMPPDGVTLNDSGDGDTGPNQRLNFPVIETASIVGPNLIVTGWARPGSIIEFFVAAADSTGFGEGQTFSFTRTEGPAPDTDATSSAYGPGAINGVVQGSDNTNRFSFSLPTPSGITGGTQLTATARVGNNTSEFSGIETVVWYPEFSVTKLSSAISDPVNCTVAGSSASCAPPGSQKRLPGAIVQYQVLVQNAGGPADLDLTMLTDIIPANAALYVGDIAGPGSGPVTFTNGATSSGLTYNYVALGDGTDDVGFSDDAGPAYVFDYTPTVGPTGCDTAVTALRVNPKGVFVADSATPDPSFTVRFWICIE